MDEAKLSPMMRQYLESKKEVPDALLFYRIGDFYEMFFEDAIKASKALDLVLTGKDCGLEERAPMCGIPYHAADSYVSKLVSQGFKVAIGEQVEDPKLAKGLVKREIIRVITPGTQTEETALEEGKNNYLSAISPGNSGIGIATVDISTGELYSLSVSDSFLGGKDTGATNGKGEGGLWKGRGGQNSFRPFFFLHSRLRLGACSLGKKGLRSLPTLSL